MAEVFLSYARANEAVARRVAGALKANGFDVWFDEQLPAHRAYSEIIEQKLRSASAVVVLWSEEAAQSQWVRAEADFARTNHKLVQAQLDGTIPPLPFNQIQCADLTGWRGNRRHKGWTKLLESVSSVASGEKPQEAGPATADRRARSGPKIAIAAAAAVMLLVVAALFLVPRLLDSSDGPPRVAVLPFEGVGGSDQGLVVGIWEDTRQALSRNPQLLVLGPNTSEEIAKGGSGAARRAADYLVHASVRTAADRVRITTSLVRSRDGAQIWSQIFDRKLDDVFALQAQIAQEIEGRVRGRLARGGGTLPEHITTTGEVYALYSEARATIRNRDIANHVTARQQLQQAVKLDPNFAPAWAALAMAERLAAARTAHSRATGKEPEAYARRAIELAPNLAAGHAALAFAIEGPVAEAALRRAAALDPNDVEVLTWLASVEYDRGRPDKALELYDRALRIEPLWWPAVLSRLELWFDTDQAAAVGGELARVDRLGDPRLSAFAHMAASEWRGDLSEAVRVGLDFRRRVEPSERAGVDDYLASLLLRLGHDELSWQLSNAPPNAPLMWRNDPKGLAMFEARNIPAAAFWKIHPMAEVVSRTYVTMRREDRLVQLYQSAAASPDEFLAELGSRERFIHLATIVAVACRRTGEQAEAERLIDAVAKALDRPARNRINLREQAISTARLRAVQGHEAAAVAALRDGVERGWLPIAPRFKPDLQDDAALGLLKDVPQFQQIRAQVLARLAKERAELGPVLLEPVKTTEERRPGTAVNEAR